MPQEMFLIDLAHATDPPCMLPTSWGTTATLVALRVEQKAALWHYMKEAGIACVSSKAIPGKLYGWTARPTSARFCTRKRAKGVYIHKLGQFELQSDTNMVRMALYAHNSGEVFLFRSALNLRTPIQIKDLGNIHNTLHTMGCLPDVSDAPSLQLSVQVVAEWLCTDATPEEILIVNRMTQELI